MMLFSKKIVIFANHFHKRNQNQVDHPIKQVALLGSTGSIGTQTIDIIRRNPHRFRLTLLTAKRNWRLLADQARELKPRHVVISDHSYYEDLRRELADCDVAVHSGSAPMAQLVAEDDVDMVVTATVGYSGMIPTVSAIKAGKTIALANKETLVVAGEVIERILKDSKSVILPVDSEHSAIFQCLAGENRYALSKIILTASGGPFRTLPAHRLPHVTAADALRHPNWDMGAKVTIDSASMMNKGFEMIEARWLFNCPPEDIEIVVHPQSIVHSMVEFSDGSVKAQLGVPDMHLPISYALGYPERIPHSEPPMRLDQYANLTFEKPDFEKFPLLGLAFDAIRAGGTAPCALNAANEKAVEAFLKGEIRFTDMASVARYAMARTPMCPSPEIDDLVAANEEALALADEAISNLKHSR